VVTSAHFFYLSEMVVEAADYLAGHDRVAMERLHDAGRLLAEIGERETAMEGGQGNQPVLPGLGAVWENDL
jgi:hypothetical protein